MNAPAPNSITLPQTIPLPARLVVEIMEYLSQRPHREVVSLMNRLNAEVQQSVKPEKIPPKLPESAAKIEDLE